MDRPEEQEAEDHRKEQTQDDPYKGRRIALNLGVFLTRQPECPVDQLEVNRVALGHPANLDPDNANG